MFEVKIFTLYPDLYPGPLNTGIYKKAQESKIWDLKVINIRDYATDKHSSVAATPFGGGNGMLERPDVVASALDSNLESNETTIYLSPKGKKFDPNLHQAMAEIEDDKSEVGAIVQEIQCGYMLGDRLLRPALVGVAKKKRPKKGEK